MSTPEAARQAALLLHAMPPADRQWVLSSIAAPQRSRLQGLLQELHRLGIPRDETLLPLPQPSAGQRLAAMGPVEQRWLAARLLAEGPQFAARLLGRQPWREAVLRYCPEGFRCEVMAAAVTACRLLDDAVCEAVADLLQHEAPQAAATRGWRLPWRRRP